MSYGDQLSDIRSNAFAQIIRSFSDVPNIDALEHWKSIVLKQHDLYSMNKNIGIDEVLCRSVLDDFFLLDSAIPISCSIDEVAGFMRIFPEFRSYCVMQVEGAGLLGRLKYVHPLTHGLDFLREAIGVSS